MRNGKHNSIGWKDHFQRHQLNAIFVHGVARQCQRVVHLDRGAERLQFTYDIDDPRIANIRDIFLEGQPKHGHELGRRSVTQYATQTFARDPFSHAVVDPAPSENKFGVVTGLIVAVCEIIWIAADEVDTDKPWRERK